MTVPAPQIIPVTERLAMLSCRPVPSDPSAAPFEPRQRVLLIEDDEIQSRALLRLLSMQGIHAHNVSSASAGLSAIASQPAYDAIVCDRLLPGLSGDELARRLRRPLLIAYSGTDECSPWFDAAVTKPAVRPLLQLLRTRRWTVVVTELADEGYCGLYKEGGLRCKGNSPAHVLRLLAAALERS